MEQIKIVTEEVNVKSKVKKLPINISKIVAPKFKIPRKIKKRLKATIGGYYGVWLDGIRGVEPEFNMYFHPDINNTEFKQI